MANGRIAQEQAYWGQEQSLDELKRKYTGLQPWQVEARDPEAYRLLYQQEEVAPTGLADKHMLTDLLGNFLWTTGEELTMGATTGLDIWGGGVGRDARGVQEGEDHSWAGSRGG